ncbi:putative oxidoreductase GLYR1 [Spatholobus suberectus]|nr:putative oxidoreductase GLYR1 [Spatholobus suberectus]
MAINTGQIDLNSDAVLFDRENEVVGVKSTVSNVSVGVCHSETLGGDAVSGGEVVVHDQKVCHVGDGRGVNDSVVLLSSVNHGCDVMINGRGKGGLGEEHELVGVGIDLEEGVEVGAGGCDEKEGELSCGVVKNEGDKSVIECSDGVMFAYGGAEPDGGLVFEFKDGFQSELECENAGEVGGNGLLSIEVASNNVAQGGDNDAAECGQEVKNDALVNLSVVVESDGERNAADSLVIKDGLNDSRAAEVATYQLQDGIPCMEVVDVNAEESLHMKDLSRNHLELEPSYQLKPPAVQVDAQLDVMMQNQIVDIDISEAWMFENIQNECRGFNLVVDLNSYRNMQEVGMYQESVFSELNFCVSDLVWGKVTGHPWWPGQIFDASAASEKAKRHLKEGCYLIAYFGDQTFAWTDVSMIKPFQMHFSQMVKQSNLKNFHHAVNCALEEVSRRVEFGLSCPCMPENVLSKLKTQVISNAGINNQLSRRNGGDRFINAMSFEPIKLVNFVKSLAQLPLVESDRLDFVIARAQLLAFYRSKGYSQLPEFTVLGGLFENDMETLLMRGKEQCDYQIDELELKTHVGYSQTRKHTSGDSKRCGKKHKLLSDLMSEKSFYISNGEPASEQKAKSVSQRPGRKRKTAYNNLEDYLHNSRDRKLTQLRHASINEMRSQLCLAAKDPTGESCSSDMVHFFAEFRKSISRDYSAYLDQGMSLEQMHDGETRVTSMVALASMTSAMEPCNDSYWTDRIIQSIPEEQSLTRYQNERASFLPETLTEANLRMFKLLPDAEISTDLGFKQQDTDRNLESEPSKLVEHLDESSKEGFCPTALTLKFTNLDSVPSTTDLNKIFGHFGPLIESKTELLEKTNRARVVFQRRSDAETAFSSAGKYSIFGPSLVSYRLKILPRKPQKVTGKRGRKRRKITSSVDGAAV